MDLAEMSCLFHRDRYELLAPTSQGALINPRTLAEPYQGVKQTAYLPLRLNRLEHESYHSATLVVGTWPFLP